MMSGSTGRIDTAGRETGRAMNRSLAVALVVSVVIVAVAVIARRATPTIQTLPYGALPEQVYDLYPAAPDASPALLVIIHGGAGFSGGRADVLSRALAKAFKAQGWTCVSLDYRAMPDHPWPAALLDSQRAIRYLSGHYHRPIILVGYSVGGLLAELVAAGNPVVVGVVAISTPQDLATLPRNEWARLWFANCKLADGSPLHHIGRLPATILIHGLADDMVPVEQARRMDAALRQHGSSVTLILLPGVDHFAKARSRFPSVVRRYVVPWVSTVGADRATHVTYPHAPRSAPPYCVGSR
jgi:acetyl esterase/lipase